MVSEAKLPQWSTEIWKNYTKIYSLVVTWFSIGLIFILSVINRWHTQQVDFLLAYPRAPIEHNLYMRLPTVIDINTGNEEMHMLKLINNLYIQKQAGIVCNNYLTNNLLIIGFKTSAIDE